MSVWHAIYIPLFTYWLFNDGYPSIIQPTSEKGHLRLAMSLHDSYKPANLTKWCGSQKCPSQLSTSVKSSAAVIDDGEAFADGQSVRTRWFHVKFSSCLTYVCSLQENVSRFMTQCKIDSTTSPSLSWTWPNAKHNIMMFDVNKHDRIILGIVWYFDVKHHDPRLLADQMIVSFSA